MKAACRVGIVALLAAAALFIFLSVDLQLRIWEWRDVFERPGDALVIMVLETCRSLVIAAAIALAAATGFRSGRDRAACAGALAIGFLVLAYAQATFFTPFPGEQQERLALWLRAHDVPAALLGFAFTSVVWPLWAGAAALLRFAALQPRVDPAAVHAAGAADRRGLLRGAGPAGRDIGAEFRRTTAWLLAAGALRPLPLALAALAGGILHHLLGRLVLAQVLGVAALAFALGVAITLLRAAHAAADALERRRLQALRRGALATAAGFVAVTGLSLVPGTLAELFAAGLLTLAPLALLAGAARALFPGRSGSADPAVAGAAAGVHRG